MKEIPLTRGMIAFVDDEDFERLKGYAWYAHKPNPKSGGWYARRDLPRVNGKRVREYMHHAVIGKTRTDHKDGDGLNNQRHNLRPCSQTLNMGNRSGNGNRRYKGIWENANRPGTFSSQVQCEGQKYLLGTSFVSAEDAAQAYDVKALELFGEFAKLNFPKRAQS